MLLTNPGFIYSKKDGVVSRATDCSFCFWNPFIQSSLQDLSTTSDNDLQKEATVSPQDF